MLRTPSLPSIATFVCLALSVDAAAATTGSLWARENLMAWCVVPYDAKKRGPEERAAMLEKLQLRKLAYDWRAEQVSTFDAEVTAMRQRGIEIAAWWFPQKLDANAQKILEVIARHKIRPELWVTGGGAMTKDAAEQKARVGAEAARIRPIAEAAAALGCKVGLYNHGGWFGEPENQLEVLAELRAAGFTNVGLVYNFHHGHDHLDRFAAMWPKMQSAVLALNLNGMAAGADKAGRKIMYVGDGDREGELMRIVQSSGWRGPIGILNHQMDVDAEAALRRNLDGVERIAATLRLK